jgi:molybdopterin converting factor small subunit
MATGTIRFWAAARAAAGVAEEAYDAATLADALAAARAGHGDVLARVLDRCSYVVDDAPVGGRAHDSVVLTEGGSIEVLPPFAGGSSASAAPAAPAAPADRLSATVAGVAAGLVAAALAGLALLGIGPLAGGLFVVQVVIALAWLAVLDVRGGGGGFVIVVGTSAVMDSVLGLETEPDIGRAAGTVGVAFVVCLLYQLARRPRVGVTASLAGAVSAITFAVCAASYIALRVETDGEFAVVAALLGAGVALAVARMVDLAVPRPAASPGSRRGVAGIVVGVAAAVLVGWAYGSRCEQLGSDHAARLALVTAVIALIADLAIDSVLAAAPPADDRPRSALPPLAILLPVALAGPAAYVAGRILLG